MNFKVSSLFLAIFTLMSVLSSQKFASACVLECEGRCVYFALEDRFALHVFGFKELDLSYFPCLSLVSNRQVLSTVEHGSYFLHRHGMFHCHSFQVALHPEVA